MSSNPQISVVIATRNRRQMLLRTLQTIFTQDIAPEFYEVIVVVDGATDGTAEALRQLHPPCALRVLERVQGGISPARNAGIKAAQGEIVLILDDDILCEPDVLRQHLTAHQNSPPGVVVGAFPVSPESPLTLAAWSIRQGSQDWVNRFALDPHLRWPFDAAVEPNTSIHRTVLEKFGGFDESIPYQREDAEIGMRFWKHGVPFRYFPAAVIHHVVVKKSRDVVRRDSPLFGRNDLLLARKIPEYRPYSVPGRTSQGTRGLRLLRRLVAALPFSPASLFCALLWPLEKLAKFERFRRWGVTLLLYGSSAVSFRSAARTAGSWSALGREFGMRLPVFMYHHIGEKPRGCPPGLSISPEIFERQIRWLAGHGYKAVRVTDWAAWIREGKPLPEKPLLLTFDDAYADTAKHALPVLQRYGFSGVVFVVTGQIGQTNAWDEAVGYPTLNIMTAEQIRHWAGRGIEFGAHTRTHPDLRKLSPQQLEDEIAGSGADLSELLQARVTSFAYPFGFFNAAAHQVAGRVFDLAFTTEEGLNNLGTDPHAQLRVRVLPEDPMVKLGWRATFGFDPAERLRTRVIIPIFFGAAEKNRSSPSG